MDSADGDAHGAAPCSYPLSLDLRGRSVVVAGAGPIAQRKVEGLLAAGAAVRVVAPHVTPALRALADGGAIDLARRPFEAADVDGAALAFAATGDDAADASVREAARAAGILVGDTSDARRGDFRVPAVHRAGPITVAVDTAGTSPSFAKRIRDDVARLVDVRYERAAATLARMRAYALIALPESDRACALARLAGADLDQLAAMSPAAAEDAVDIAVAALRATSAARSAERPRICATRRSALALWQARHVMTLLAERGVASTVLEVTTVGDRVQDRPLAALGTDSIFVRELERALREHAADYAVHSCKDLPSSLPDDMRLAAIGPREDPRDAFCSEKFATLDALPPGSLVGTSSPRRVAQLAAWRADLRFEPIRGNVDTRLRKLREGRYDAVILAVAGLSRLGLRATHTVPIDPDRMLPAAGQGALAAECRADDAELARLLAAALGDLPATLAVCAERALLRRLGAGCQAPVGAFGRTETDGELTLAGIVAAVDGSRSVRAERTRAVTSQIAAEELGVALADELLAAGAEVLLGAACTPLLSGKLFLLPRTQDRESRIAPALRSVGAEVIEARDSADAARALGGRVPDVLLFPSSGSVSAIGPYLAALRAEARRPLVAAMGAASSEAASQHGFPADVVAREPAIGPFVHTVTQYVLEKA